MEIHADAWKMIESLKRGVAEVTNIIKENQFELSENNAHLNVLEQTCVKVECNLDKLLSDIDGRIKQREQSYDDMSSKLSEKEDVIEELSEKIDRLRTINESVAATLADKEVQLKECSQKAFMNERLLTETRDRLEAVENELGFMENDRDDLETKISEQDHKLQCLRDDMIISRERKRAAEYTTIKERWYCNETMRRLHKKNEQMTRERRRWVEAILKIKNKGKLEELNVAFEDVLKNLDAEDQIRQLEIKIAELELLKLEDRREKSKFENELSRLRYIIQMHESSTELRRCFGSGDKYKIWGSEGDSPTAFLANMRHGEGDCLSSSVSPIKSTVVLQSCTHQSGDTSAADISLGTIAKSLFHQEECLESSKPTSPLANLPTIVEESVESSVQTESQASTEDKCVQTTSAEMLSLETIKSQSFARFNETRSDKKEETITDKEVKLVEQPNSDISHSKHEEPVHYTVSGTDHEGNTTMGDDYHVDKTAGSDIGSADQTSNCGDLPAVSTQKGLDDSSTSDSGEDEDDSSLSNYSISSMSVQVSSSDNDDEDDDGSSKYSNTDASVVLSTAHTRSEISDTTRSVCGSSNPSRSTSITPIKSSDNPMKHSTGNTTPTITDELSVKESASKTQSDPDSKANDTMVSTPGSTETTTGAHSSQRGNRSAEHHPAVEKSKCSRSSKYSYTTRKLTGASTDTGASGAPCRELNDSTSSFTIPSQLDTPHRQYNTVVYM